MPGKKFGLCKNIMLGKILYQGKSDLMILDSGKSDLKKNLDLGKSDLGKIWIWKNLVSRKILDLGKSGPEKKKSGVEKNFKSYLVYFNKTLLLHTL